MYETDDEKLAAGLDNVFSTRDRVETAKDLDQFIEVLIEFVAVYEEWDQLNARNFLEGLSLYFEEEVNMEGGAFTEPGELRGRGMTWNQVADALVTALDRA